MFIKLITLLSLFASLVSIAFQKLISLTRGAMRKYYTVDSHDLLFMQWDHQSTRHGLLLMLLGSQEHPFICYYIRAQAFSSLCWLMLSYASFNLLIEFIIHAQLLLCCIATSFLFIYIVNKQKPAAFVPSSANAAHLHRINAQLYTVCLHLDVGKYTTFLWYKSSDS